MAATFAGAKLGFFFGMGDAGLGYYPDAMQQHLLDEAAANMPGAWQSWTSSVLVLPSKTC